MAASYSISSTSSSSRTSSPHTSDSSFYEHSGQSTGLSSLDSDQRSSSNSSYYIKEQQRSSTGIALTRCDSPTEFTFPEQDPGPRRPTGVALSRYGSSEPSQPSAYEKKRTFRNTNAIEGSPIRVPAHSNSTFGQLCKSIFTPKKKVVRDANHYYFDPLPEPVLVLIERSKMYPPAGDLRLQYNVPKDFILIQSLDGAGGKLHRTYLSAQYPYQPNDFKQFVVLRAFEKEPGPVKLDRTTSRYMLRQELRVIKRLAGVEKSARKFVLNSEGCVESGGYHYLVLPFMRCDLLDVLTHKDIKIDKCAYSKTWIAQMASGLACLHANGIIHRNLKPTNVLLDWDGSLKIADFARSYVAGIGRDFEPLRSGMRYAYRYRGTRIYMAPEVRDMIDAREAIETYGRHDYDEMIDALKGYGKEVDIWSLGCIAAEILRLDGRFEALFYSEKDYEWYIAGRKSYHFEFLERFGIHGHIVLDFVRRLLNPIPSARMRIVDIEHHPFYRDSVNSFDDFLKVRIPKAERPTHYELKQNLALEPRAGSLVRTVATPPSCNTPSPSSLEDYTWINEPARKN